MNARRENCRQMERLVQSVADGAATERERASLDLHLAGCEGCRQALAETRHLRAMLADSPSRATSAEFERRLSQAVARQKPAAGSTWGGRWERLRLRYEWQLRLPALCAAGSLAVALVAVNIAPQLVAPTREEGSAHLATALRSTAAFESPAADWDTVQASVELSTGSVLEQ
jgi:anti-sigma factor RsiW